MATGFLLADALNEALRLPYQRGNIRVTSSYLINGLKIGKHRVLLKRNFDTACWIPPVGNRASHSIYYGDRMMMRTIDFFCKKNKIVGIPDDKALLELCIKRAGEKQSKPSASMIFDEKVNWLKSNLPKDQWDSLLETVLAAVAAYGRHEREHARNTSQDLERTNRDLRLLGIPFRMFNLFEDSRIEHISRQEQETPFGWLEIEELAPSGNPDPVELYFRCIQLEGEPDAEMLECNASFGKSGKLTVAQAAERVQDYYQRACACTTDEKLYPIMEEFLKEFKEDMPSEGKQSGEAERSDNSSDAGESSGGSGKDKSSESDADGNSENNSGSSEDEDNDQSGAEERAGDLSTAAEAAEQGDSFFDDFDSDAEVVGGSDEAGRKAEEEAKAKLSAKADRKADAKSKGILESLNPDSSGGVADPSYFLARHAGTLDANYQKRVENLTQKLLQLFKTHNLNQALESPGKRLSSRHLARGDLRYLHPKQFGGKGKRKYTILYDCSGSMRGQPDREGKLFLLALNNLAKRGYLEGNLILSGFVGGKPGWLSYKFPLNDETILRINPVHSAEGLKWALEDNLKIIRGVDDVFVYTDAHICDTPMDQSFFARNRVWPVGLYVGSENQASEMSRHFPQYIIRDTIEELVEKMLIRNRRTVG